VSFGASGTEFTGTFTEPGVGNVESGVTYGGGGTEFTGTFGVPAVADVESGVSFGAGGTEFTGTFSEPGVGNVESGVTYGGDGTEFTGTFGVPAVAYVADSIQYGAGGTEFTGTIADCSSNGEDGCYLDSAGSYDAGDLTNLSAGNIKRGISLAGVTGNFPSSTSPLPRYSDDGGTTNTTGSNETDLTLFVTQLTSDGTFEFWDSAGQRYTGSGDSDIANANVMDGVQFENLSITGSGAPDCTGDGETGCLTTTTYKAIDTSAVSDWDIRVGKSAGGISGALKTSCRNRVNLSVYDDDSNGTAEWWDTIDDWNNDGAFPTALVSGWTSATDCDKSNWEDLTSDGACDTAGDDCIMQDKITGLQWSESYPVASTAAASTTDTWDTAISHCDNLTNYGGHSDWRLPTQKELQEAYIHGIRDLGYKGSGTIRPSGDTLDNNDDFMADVDSWFWSASSQSNMTWNAWFVDPSAGYTNAIGKAYSRQFLCVR
jgi:hypothetical protein